MGVLPFRSLQPTVGGPRQILGNGGGRADIIMGLLGMGGGGAGAGGVDPFGGSPQQGGGQPPTLNHPPIIAPGPGGLHQGGGPTSIAGANGGHIPVGYGANGHPFFNMQQFNAHAGQRSPASPFKGAGGRGGNPQPRSFRQALIERAMMGQLQQ